MSAAPSPADIQRARSDREAAVLLRFCSGHRLSPAEMADVQHLLPVEVLAAPPTPRAEYRHPYAHYASLLGCDVRRIKDYVSRAYEAAPPDFPPFDRPAEFLAWWHRRMHRTAPDRVLAFARAAGPVSLFSSSTEVGKTDTPPAASSASVPPPSPPADPVRPPLPFEDAGAGGFEASVRELRAAVASAQSRLRRAMAATPLDESLVASCNRAVREQLDLLRKAENDLFDMQHKRGELVPLAEVREDWRTLIAALRMMRRRMQDNIAAALAKLTHAVDGRAVPLFNDAQLAAVATAVGDERAREEQLLRGSKFWLRSDDAAA